MNPIDHNQLLLNIQNDINEISKDPLKFQFNRCLKKAEALRSPLQNGVVKDNFVREMYDTVMKECCNKLNYFSVDQTNPTINLLVFDEPRMIETIYQYHLFHTGHLNDEDRSRFQKDINYRKQVVDEISGYLTAGTIFASKLVSATTPSSPDIWAYSVISDRFILAHLNFERDLSYHENIFIRIIRDAFSAIKGISSLLAVGQNSCATTLWRHLHELECIILILNNHGENAIISYFEHQHLTETENNDSAINEAMSLYKAKIGNNKLGFINYGWLLKIPDFINNWDEKGYKLDMSKGLQRFAQLEAKQQGYKNASKILHPTAYMLNITPEKYYIITMELLYDSTVNIANTAENFISNANLMKDTGLLKFKKSVERDLKRLNDNIQIIRKKFPREYAIYQEIL